MISRNKFIKLKLNYTWNVNSVDNKKWNNSKLNEINI